MIDKIRGRLNTSIVNPYVILFVGVVSVSFAAIFIRLAEAPPLVIAACRLALASIILIPIASFKAKSNLKGLPRRDILLLGLCSIFIALHFGLWITSLSYTSIASSVVLVTAHPAFVAIISYFLWGERLNRLTIGGIVVAMVGIVFINSGELFFGPQALLGNILALVAGLAMGAYLIIGRQLRSSLDIVSYLTVVNTGAAVLLIAAAAFMGYSLFGYSATTYIMLILLAIVPQLIGHSSLNMAVRLVPAILVSVAILGEPVGATILGGLILNESPTTSEILGGILIIAGIFMVVKYGSARGFNVTMKVK
jgi:drug/metabolite transporter (DMT)-like permease